MSKLLLKGKDGKECINVLESLGKTNQYNLSGLEECYGYSWDNSGYITYEQFLLVTEDYVEMTIEEYKFLYPLKIGDIVKIHYGNNLSGVIEDMCWHQEDNKILYYVNKCGWYGLEELSPVSKKDEFDTSMEVLMKEITNAESEYKSEPFAKTDINSNIHQIDADRTHLIPIISSPKIKFDTNETELLLGDDYDIVNRNGKTFVVKINKYPKNFDACCDILNIDISRTIEHSLEYPFYKEKTEYENDMLLKLKYLRKLLICRDAYWKIAGEEMGLGKPWEPAIQDSIWGITRSKDEVEKYSCHFGKTNLLEFPTVEMRDEFYENFKKEIENCKELL